MIGGDVSILGLARTTNVAGVHALFCFELFMSTKKSPVARQRIKNVSFDHIFIPNSGNIHFLEQNT